jgi:hypothetical protein
MAFRAESSTVGDRTLSIATVVYSRELDLLRIQARSIDRFVKAEGIDRIIVVVNDAREQSCLVAVEDILSEYGRFADRVDVVVPDALFALRPRQYGARTPGQHLRTWFTRNRGVYPPGKKGGWRGNRGWSIQQALKLSVARYAGSEFVLLLDAKNHFVREVSVDSFVSPEGKARTYLRVPNDKQWLWIEASFRCLGVTPPARDAPAPPTVTPVCVPRAVLRGCLEALERRVGPVEAFFARKDPLLRDNKGSEFMMLFAHVTGSCGGVARVYGTGLEPPATIHRRSTAEDVDRVLMRAERNETDILSVHSSRLATLSPEERQRLEAIWTACGLTQPAEARPAPGSAHA